MVAQRRTQLVERTTKSAMSRIGIVAQEMIQAHSVAKATIAEATFVRSQVESRIASLAENGGSDHVSLCWGDIPMART